MIVSTWVPSSFEAQSSITVCFGATALGEFPIALMYFFTPSNVDKLGTDIKPARIKRWWWNWHDCQIHWTHAVLFWDFLRHILHIVNFEFSTFSGYTHQFKLTKAKLFCCFWNAEKMYSRCEENKMQVSIFWQATGCWRNKFWMETFFKENLKISNSRN